jgi:heptosyltransferase-2
VRIVVGPGGGLPEKCWPAASYAELVAGISGASILVLGGPRETAILDAVAAASPRAWHESPALRQVFSLVSAADLVVCNSSMLMHAAAAFSKTTLVLLGPAFPSARLHQAQWGYPGICRSFGRETGERESLYTPAEILSILREEIRACR